MSILLINQNFFHFLCLLERKSFILDIEKKWIALWHGQHIKLPIQHHFYSRISHRLGFWYIGTSAKGSLWLQKTSHKKRMCIVSGTHPLFIFHRFICYLRQCFWQLNWCLDTGGRNYLQSGWRTRRNMTITRWFMCHVSNNGGLVGPIHKINSALPTILLSRGNVVSGWNGIRDRCLKPDWTSKYMFVLHSTISECQNSQCTASELRAGYDG